MKLLTQKKFLMQMKLLTQMKLLSQMKLLTQKKPRKMSPKMSRMRKRVRKTMA